MKHIIILTTLILFSALLNAEENKNIDLIVKENSTSIMGNESNAWNIYTSGVMEPATRNSIKDKWWNHTINLPSWYIDEYGTVLTFDWREEDWNQNVEFSISANFEIKIGEWGIGIGASWKSSANKGGHHIGTSTVCFWDTSNKIYDVSGFKWKVQ